MARIRIVVLLLAVALAVPVALLVRQSLRSVAADEARRHRTLAERVFDEMERSLSGFLSAEEERSWQDYRAGRFGDEPPGFVLGHFEIADGRIRVPARAALGAEAADRIERVVETDLAARAAEEEPRTLDFEAQAPGTTVVRMDQLRALGYVVAPEADAKASAREAPAARPPAPSKTDRAYEDAIQSLNLGVEQRRKRERKIVEEEASSGFASAASPRSLAPDTEADARLVRQAAEGAADEAMPETFRDPRREELVAGRAAAPREPASAPAPALQAELGERADALARDVSELRAADLDAVAKRLTVRVAVDPLHGRSGAEHLVLSRTVWVGERGVRQGLVLDRTALAGWLRAQVFDRLALPGATVHFSPDGEPPGFAPDAYVYEHRFAEPFQGETALLALAPLAAVRGEGAVYALAGLLVLVGAAGLFAVYRTVAVTIGFAERRSNFVAAVTHELKTPLTSIRMYGEMLRDDIVPDEAKRREYYRTITAESERLGRLINNVLEFSRLEKGTREMNLVTGDLGAVVREMAELVRPHAEAEGFALEVEIEPDLPPVEFDRDALLQVLFNLVDNAVKYAATAKQRRISVVCRSRSGDEGGVELRVRDHGPGVPGRHLAKVFEPFYRGEDELTRRSKGTGLGLALVKGLAERMGAAIQGRNVPEGGFEVRIAF